MSVANLTSINIESISNLKKLLDKLHDLGAKLPESNLSRLTAFNSAYIVITSAIKKSLDSGYFENPKFIEKFTLEFSHHYLQVINDALAGSATIPVAWSKLVSKKTPKRLPNFIYLIMGANAHINHDLSLVMVKMLDSDDTNNLVKDIIKVDGLLKNSGKDILGTFTEEKKLPRFIKNKLSYVYLPVVMRIILYWRVLAWRDYLVIKNSGISPDRSKTKGKTVSNVLLRLGSLL